MDDKLLISMPVIIIVIIVIVANSSRVFGFKKLVLNLNYPLLLAYIGLVSLAIIKIYRNYRREILEDRLI